MKKLLFLLVLLVGMSSCYVDVEDSIEDPKKETTVELQELPKDTAVISIDEYKLYVFDEQGLVKYEAVSKETVSEAMNPSVVFIFTVVAFFIGLVVGLNN